VRMLLTALAFAAMITAAVAQTPPMPKTVKLYNNANGETIGTITQWNGVFYLRDAKGGLIAQMLFKDGKKTFLDASGKPIDPLLLGDLKLPSE
jgi:hypothetical protein